MPYDYEYTQQAAPGYPLFYQGPRRRRGVNLFGSGSVVPGVPEDQLDDLEQMSGYEQAPGTSGVNQFAQLAGLAAHAISPKSWGGRLGANMAGLAMRNQNRADPYNQLLFQSRMAARAEQARQKQLEGVLKPLRGTPARLSVDETPQTPEAGRVGMNISGREIPAQVPQITPEQVAQLSGLLPKEAIEPTLGAFRNIGQLPTEADANTRRAFETMADPRFGLMTDREATHGKEGLGWKFKTPTESPSKYQTTYEQDPHTKEWYEVEYQEGREGTRRLGLVTPRTKQEKIDIKPEETANQGFFTRNPSEDIVSKQTGEVTSRGVAKTATENVGGEKLTDTGRAIAALAREYASGEAYADQPAVKGLLSPAIPLVSILGLGSKPALSRQERAKEHMNKALKEADVSFRRQAYQQAFGGGQGGATAAPSQPAPVGRIMIHPKTGEKIINRADGRGWVPYADQ